MNKFVKKLLCGAMAATMLFGASACGNTNNNNSVGDDGSGVLRVWGINPISQPGYDQILEVDPENPTGLYSKWLIESFEEANPNIDIQLETAGWELDLNKNIMTAIAAGTQPDTMATATYTPLLSRYGHLAKLELAEELETDIVTNMDDFCFHQGKRYAVPVTQQLFGLAINKGILRKAGILNSDNTVAEAWVEYSPLAPKTWEDFLVICNAVKTWAKGQSGENKDIGGFLFCPTSADSHIHALAIMASAGGDCADNYGEVYLNSPENVKAYEYMRELWKTTPEGNKSASSLGVIFSMFYEGKAAYSFMHPEAISYTVSNGAYPNCKMEDLVWCELPKFEGLEKKGNVTVGGILYAVLADGNNEVAAKKFIEHILSFEAQKKIFDIIGRVPVRKSVLKAIQEENTDWYKLNSYQVDPFLDESYEINKGIPVFENNTSLCWDAWNGMWQKVFTTDDDISTLLKNCHNKWVGYLAEEA